MIFQVTQGLILVVEVESLGNQKVSGRKYVFWGKLRECTIKARGVHFCDVNQFHWQL